MVLAWFVLAAIQDEERSTPDKALERLVEFWTQSSQSWEYWRDADKEASSLGETHCTEALREKKASKRGE